jgi:hypothetical protein
MDYKRVEDGEWKCMQEWRINLLQNERLKD